MKVMGIDIESTKMAKKLRAIAKHAEALANELDAIDNAWQCDCGSTEYEDTIFKSDGEVHYKSRTCLHCREGYAIPFDEDLPQPEGSD